MECVSLTTQDTVHTRIHRQRPLQYGLDGMKPYRIPYRLAEVGTHNGTDAVTVTWHRTSRHIRPGVQPYPQGSQQIGARPVGAHLDDPKVGMGGGRQTLPRTHNSLPKSRTPPSAMEGSGSMRHTKTETRGLHSC
jgi:hypothetical protein